MKTILRGTLQGVICREKHVPVANTIVRLYRVEKKDDPKAVAAYTSAQPKELFQIYEGNDLKKKEEYLIAETTSDEYGNYIFEMNGDKLQVDKEIVEIALYYPAIPDLGQANKETPKDFEPFAAGINIFYPKWREKEMVLEARFDYEISSRIWCYLLKRLDIWVIYGKLTVCNTTTPIPGVEVIAMDDDIISDDRLGSAVTNAWGEFIIFYTSKEFKKTFLSPFINVETPIFPIGNGPDIYFKFAFGGSIVRQEPPSRGRKKDRVNVGNCFCVDLCLEKGPLDPPQDLDEPIAGFLKIGLNREYHILNNIDSTTGRTANKPTTGWNDLAFYHTLALTGSLSKKLNGKPLEYKFQVQEYDSPTGSSISPWIDIKDTEIDNTVIGYKQELTGDIYNPIKITDYAIHPEAGQIAVTFDATDVWIKVPQDSGFIPNANSQLIKLITDKLTSGLVDMTKLKPGDSTTVEYTLEKNSYFRIRMVKREEGDPLTETIAGTSKVLAIFNKKYTNVAQYGSWLPGTSTERGVACLDIKELVGSGCGVISTSLTVKYTAANPNLGQVWLAMAGPGGPHSFPVITHNTPGEEAFGEAAYSGTVANLPNCAFTVHLWAALKLTNGEYGHHNIHDYMSFCK